MSTTQNGALSLYYDVAGRGEPVLWLQGLGADHTAWTVQTAHFSRAFRCILPDNRDVGRSDRAGGEYDVGDLAADALCVLDAAGVEHAHVVGLSLGASIAQRLALVAPDRVRSLVLLSSFARADARLRAVVSQWPELYEQLGRVAFHRQAEGWTFSPRFFEQPSNLRALRRYVETAPYPQEPDAFARQARAALTHDSLNELGDLEPLTLIVHGELDILVPAYLGREAASRVEGARFVLRPDVAHSVNLEGQREFNALLDAFLREH